MFDLKEYIITGKTASFIDLPNDEVICSLDLNPRLKKTLLAYNHCPKTYFDFLSQRIILLNAALTYTTDALTDLQIKSHIECKFNYLLALKHCYDDGILTRSDTIYNKNIVAPFFISSNSNKPLLYLNNKRMYSKSLNKTFGEYWLETIDPCHRPYIEYYRNLWNKDVRNPEQQPYFLWLEDKIQPNIPEITFLTEKEKQKYQIQINSGKFQQAGKDLTTEERRIFIIDDKQNIYIGPRNPHIRHTSFTHGAPVIFAGEAKIEHGNLTELSNLSGHYMPTEKDLLYTIEYLQLQNCLAENTEIDIFDELKPKKYRFNPTNNTLCQKFTANKKNNTR